MAYAKFFGGTYLDDDDENCYVVRTTRNPAGFVVTSERTGSSLTFTVYDALEFADKLGLHAKGGKHVSLEDLELRGAPR